MTTDERIRTFGADLLGEPPSFVLANPLIVELRDTLPDEQIAAC